ncbi:MAG TPA: hypothetical protein VEX63_01135 [Flavisolibacter sp.]|nr:hypothetical protein [Flavisolibacter sp.]
MNRNTFIIMALLPVAAAFIVPLGLPYLLKSALYIQIFYYIRLHYLGYRRKVIMRTLFFGPLVDSWWKMWKKDRLKIRVQ